MKARVFVQVGLHVILGARRFHALTIGASASAKRLGLRSIAARSAACFERLPELADLDDFLLAERENEGAALRENADEAFEPQLRHRFAHRRF